MSYTVYHADGTPITIPDGSIDTAYYNANSHGPGVGIGTQLVGRNTINYGAPIAQNFLQLTENFASTSAFRPGDAFALQGQLWFEKTSTTDGNLHVRTSSATTGDAANWKTILTADSTGNVTVRGGTAPAVNPTGTPNNGDIQVSGSNVSIYANGAWHETGSTTNSGTAPTTPSAGDLWYDTVNNLLKVYTNTGWTTVSTGGGGGSSTAVATVGTTAPASPVTGQMWYDTTVGVTALKIYTGSVWTVTSGGGSGTGTVTSVTVNGSSGRLTSTGSPVTTTGTITMDLASSGVSAGSYGSATRIPVLNVDTYGRVTSASTTAFTAPIMKRYDFVMSSASSVTGIPAWVPGSLTVGLYVAAYDTSGQYIAQYVEFADTNNGVINGTLFTKGNPLAPITVTLPYVSDYVGPGQNGGTFNASAGTITLRTTETETSPIGGVAWPGPPWIKGYLNQWLTSTQTFTPGAAWIKFVAGPGFAEYMPA